MGRYFVTALALEHLGEIGRHGEKTWGRAQTARYMAGLRKAFQYIANHHPKLPDKSRLTGYARLNLHAVGSHYIVFIVLAPGKVAVTSVLHQHMDVPTRLRELQGRTDNEIGDLRAGLLREQFRDD